MKKLSFLTILILISEFSFSQLSAYDGSIGPGSNELWSNNSNWNTGYDVPPVNGNTIFVFNTPSNLDVDVIFISTLLTTDAGRTSDFSITGVGTHNLTIDNGNEDRPIGEVLSIGILHRTLTAQKLLINCNLTINNTSNGLTVLRNTGHGDNIIEFGENSILDLIGNGSLGVYSDGNLATRKFNFNGVITGSKNLTVKSGDVTFGATSDNGLFSGNIFLWNGANITVDSNNIFLNGALGNSLRGNDATLTLNTAQTLSNNVDIVVNKNNHTFVVNLNADQSSLGQIQYLESGGGTIILNKASGVNLAFEKSDSDNDWNAGLGSLIINGFEEGNIRFGTDNTGLTAAQLLQITDGSGEAMALDANGYLYYASTLSIKKYEAFDFAVYPNPVKDVLRINTQEILEKIEVSDLLGRTVFKQNNISKSVNISTLNTGVYILKLTSEKGISTKKIVKD